MSKHTHKVRDDADALVRDTGNLLAHTADRIKEPVGDALKLPAAALERGKEIYGSLRRQTAKGARKIDRSMHHNLYRVIGFGISAGLFLGYLLSRPGNATSPIPESQKEN